MVVQYKSLCALLAGGLSSIAILFFGTFLLLENFKFVFEYEGFVGVAIPTIMFIVVVACAMTLFISGFYFSKKYEV